MDHWQYFNWPNILQEAQARLNEARQHPTKMRPEKDTLEFWCAWCAHANAASSLVSDERYALEDALSKIETWSRAYPLTIFPEPDLKKAAELLKAGGITLDAVSANAMRHVVEGVGKIARCALERNGGAP